MLVVVYYLFVGYYYVVYLVVVVGEQLVVEQGVVFGVGQVGVVVVEYQQVGVMVYGEIIDWLFKGLGVVSQSSVVECVVDYWLVVVVQLVVFLVMQVLVVFQLVEFFDYVE